MAITVDVYGSCVSRDIFRYAAPGKYTFCRYVTHTPVSTLYENALMFHSENIESMELTEYEKTILKIQTKKILPQLLRKNKSDILIIDLADELMKRLQVKGTTLGQIAVIDGKEAEYKRLVEKEPEYVIEGSFEPTEMDWRQLERKYRKFASEILYGASNPEGYKAEQIIVIEALYSLDTLGNDGNIHPHDKKYQIKQSNEWLKKLYELLYRYLPGCHVIKMPDFLHTSENHIHGVHPLHYMAENYYYMERALDVINHYSEVNTLENLRKEQSLRNRLDTKVVHTNLMYELQRQIENLKRK